jgi:hypothetical protein
MTERIRGKVAQLIDESTLVINRGSEHGVKPGMRFAVLNAKGAEITDPDTGEVLGSVDIEKVVVKVVRVEPKLSVARTFRTFTTKGLLIPSLVASKTYTETLRVDGSTYKEELNEGDSYVKVGDPVVQTIGDEFGGDS